MIKEQSKYFHYFYEINKIPRKSGFEKEISEYIINFAKTRNLKFYTDKFYNVVIWKKASIGLESKETLGLQAHIDMVCEKEENLEHDFLKDEIIIEEKDGFLKARGTTLGADNGIGVAYILALLDSEDIEHPNIEAIFTTQEETTMAGAKNLDGKILSAKKIISFDNFSESDMWVGSASASEWYSENILDYNEESLELETYKISLRNFLGGHSGMDIKDTNRGNPIKISGDILYSEKIFLNNIIGGSAINVIPRECEVIFSILREDKKTIENITEKVKKENQKYKFGDISITKIPTEKKCFTEKTTQNLLGFIQEFKNGALYKDDKDNVIVSGNFSKISISANKVNLEYSIRSNRKKLGDKINSEILEIMKKYNVSINKFDYLKGYEQPENTQLIEICKQSYMNIMKKDPNILGVQACLECEFLGEKISNLQYVALGTNIYDAHSPKEKVEIESVKRTWKVLIDVLKNI